jgi:uncharacterized protein YceH (UPF0502 family)
VDRLTAREGRVVASLVEKSLTVPQYYPLTLNALVAACNQTTSRDPVTSYGEAEVLDAIESLKTKRMVRAVLPSHGRAVVRYRHVLDELLGLDEPQLAVLAVLVLRGPQTAAELRARTERMAVIDSLDHELELLSSRADPLCRRVPRGPGQKEDRWTSLLAEPFCDTTRTAEEPLAAKPVLEPSDVEALRRDLEAVKAELESLRAALGALQGDVDDLRTDLGA